MSQMSEGGEGATLIGTLSQIFPFFFSDASPKYRWYRSTYLFATLLQGLFSKGPLKLVLILGSILGSMKWVP